MSENAPQPHHNLELSSESLSSSLSSLLSLDEDEEDEDDESSSFAFFLAESDFLAVVM